MQEHKCNKEVEFALYNKTQKDMVSEIKEIKEDIKTITYWVEVIKWMFADMRLNNAKERQEMIDLIKQDVKEHYADKKDVEITQKDVNFLKKSFRTIIMSWILVILASFFKIILK